MINKLIEVQFGKPCADFWAKYPDNCPLNCKRIHDWKQGFKKHGKFNKKGTVKPPKSDTPRWQKGSSSNYMFPSGIMADTLFSREIRFKES